MSHKSVINGDWVGGTHGSLVPLLSIAKRSLHPISCNRNSTTGSSPGIGEKVSRYTCWQARDGAQCAAAYREGSFGSGTMYQGVETERKEGMRVIVEVVERVLRFPFRSWRRLTSYRKLGCVQFHQGFSFLDLFLDESSGERSENFI